MPDESAAFTQCQLPLITLRAQLEAPWTCRPRIFSQLAVLEPAFSSINHHFKALEHQNRIISNNSSKKCPIGQHFDSLPP